MTEKIENILQYLDEQLHPIISPEHWNVYSELHDMISGLLMESQWTPVTEGLPKVKQRVLVQQKDGFMMVRKCIDGGHLAWFYSDIVAWMPLPKSWEGDNKDAKD